MQFLVDLSASLLSLAGASPGNQVDRSWLSSWHLLASELVLHCNRFSQGSLCGLHGQPLLPGLICLYSYQVFYLRQTALGCRRRTWQSHTKQSLLHLVDGAANGGYVCFLDCLLTTPQTQGLENFDVCLTGPRKATLECHEDMSNFSAHAWADSILSDVDFTQALDDGVVVTPDVVTDTLQHAWLTIKAQIVKIAAKDLTCHL